MAYKIKKQILHQMDTVNGRITLAHAIGQGESSIKALILANAPDGNLTKLSCMEAIASYCGIKPLEVVEKVAEKVKI